MSNAKSFLKNAALFQILNWLIKPLWIFLIDREVQNTLGEAVYGEYMVLFNFSLLFLIILDPGMHNYQTREIAANPRFGLVNAPGLLWFKQILSLAYLLIVGSLGAIQGFNLYWLILLISNQLISSWILYFRSLFAGYQLFIYDAIFSVLDRFFAIILVFIFLFGETLRPFFSISIFLELQMLALLGSFIAALFIVKQRKLFWRIPFPSYQKIKQLLSNNLPYALLALIMGLYTRLDVILIKYLDPNEFVSVGLYAHGYRFLDAASMYVMLFTGLLFPMLSKLLKEKKGVRTLIERVLVWVWLPGIWMLWFAIYYGESLLSKMYVFENIESLQQSKAVLIGLMASYLPMAGALVLGALLTAAAQISSLVKVTFLSLLVLLLSALIFIPLYGPIGAAIAVTITQTVVFLFFTFLCYRLYKTLPSSFLVIVAKLILVTILFVATHWFIQQSVGTEIAFWAATFCFIVCILFLGLLPIKSLVRLLKKEA